MCVSRSASRSVGLGRSAGRSVGVGRSAGRSAGRSVVGGSDGRHRSSVLVDWSISGRRMVDRWTSVGRLAGRSELPQVPHHYT